MVDKELDVLVADGGSQQIKYGGRDAELINNPSF